MTVLLKQSTARNLMLKLYLTSDHIAAATGKTLTVTVSKDGGAFAAAGATVTEIASGWYKLALTTTDTNTLGTLIVRATATSSDDAELVAQVVAFDPGVAWSTYAGGAVASVTGAVGSVTGNVGGNVTGAVASVTGNVGGNVVGSVASVTGAVGSVTGSVASVTGNVGGNVVGSVASVTAGVTLAAAAVTAIWASLASAAVTVGSLGKLLADTLDATISSRLATSGYTAPSTPPTATAIADAILTRDWNSVSGEASRSVLNALRAIRNKVSRSGSTLTVTKENDATSAWTAAITTNPALEAIAEIDPA